MTPAEPIVKIRVLCSQNAPTRKPKHSIPRTLICPVIVAAACPLFGAVRMQIHRGLPIVDGVYVNGYGPYRFLLDTGTNVNLIDANLARSIHLPSNLRTKVSSSTGVIEVTGGDGIELALGAAKVGDQEFLFLRPEVIRAPWPEIQGVIGQWFLSWFDYTLDLRVNRLEFGKRDRSGTRVRIAMVNGEPVVSTSLGNLVLDSGARQLVLFGVRPDIADGLQGELRTVTGWQPFGMVASKPLIIEGRRVWRGDAVVVPNRTEPGVDGLLPLSLFKAIYFCNSERYVVFE